jgi:hypothetical protein
MYHDPNTVISPKDMVKSVEVIYDAGPVDESWSVARLKWGDSPVVGIRWNGDSRSSKGTPRRAETQCGSLSRRHLREQF